MNKTVKKALQFGVGSYYYARDKANKTVARLRKEGVFDEKDSKKIVKETVEQAKVGLTKTAETLKGKFKEIQKKGEKAETEVKETKNAVEEEVEKTTTTKAKK